MENPGCVSGKVPSLKCEVDECIDLTDNTNGAHNFNERFACAYMGKSLRSDMTFFVEMDNTSIPAHSLIVAAASEVLERFIFGTGSIVNTDRVVKVPNCPLTECKVLLWYLYTGLVDPDISIESACILLPLAHYFSLHHFEALCAERIEVQLTPQTVCDTFDKIHFMDIPLTTRCLEIMEQNTNILLKDGSLMRMQVSSLDKIMKSDWLNISCESNLLAKMLLWADEECAKSKLEPTSANRRSIINDRIYYIRFAAMSAELFCQCVSKVGEDFFTKDEIVKILYGISIKDYCEATITKKSFSSKPRQITRRLKLVRGGLFNSISNSVETIYQHNTTKTYVVGFAFDGLSRITSILDSNHQPIPFTQAGTLISFTRHISFNDKKCCFIIKCINSDFPLNRYRVTSLNGDPNIYMSPNALSALASLSVR